MRAPPWLSGASPLLRGGQLQKQSAAAQQRRLKTLPGLEGTQWLPTPGQVNASWPSFEGNLTDWSKWLLLPVKEVNGSKIVGYLPIVQNVDEQGFKQWYLLGTGLRFGGRDAASGVMTNLLQPSALGLPDEMGNNARSASRATAHGFGIMPASAQAAATAIASRELVGRTNATAQAVAEGELVMVVFSDAVALAENNNVYGTSTAKAESEATGIVAGTVHAQATAVDVFYGSGRVSARRAGRHTGGQIGGCAQGDRGGGAYQRGGRLLPAYTPSAHVLARRYVCTR